MKIRLGDFIKVQTGKLDANAAIVNGKYPFFTCAKAISHIDSYSYECEAVLVAGNGDLNVKYFSGRFDAYQRTYIIESINKNQLNTQYIYWFMIQYIDRLRNKSIGGVIKYIKLSDITDIKIPFVDIEEQKRIVYKLSLIQSILEMQEDLLVKLDDLIKSRFVEMFGDINAKVSKYEIRRWNDLVTIINGRDYKQVLVETGGYPVYGSGGIIARANAFICLPGTVIVGRKGSINNPILVEEPFWNVDTAFGVVPGDKLDKYYFYYFCKFFDFNKLNKTTTLPSLIKKDLLNIGIPLPPIEEQTKFGLYVNQINKLKSDVQKSIDETQLLMDSLMQEYFG